MIDTQKEQLLTLSEAAHSVPVIDGKRPHPSTIFRWIRDGVRGGVRLEHVRVGGRICTTREALERFMHEAAMAPPPSSLQHKRVILKKQTPRYREAAIAAAQKRLAAAGLGEHQTWQNNS